MTHAAVSTLSEGMIAIARNTLFCMLPRLINDLCVHRHDSSVSLRLTKYLISTETHTHTHTHTHTPHILNIYLKTPLQQIATHTKHTLTHTHTDRDTFQTLSMRSK